MAGDSGGSGAGLGDSFEGARLMNAALKVLVYGLGRSGSGVAELLARQGHQVMVYDSKPEEVTKLLAQGFMSTSTPQEAEAQLCIAAPGVPYDHPDLSALRARGIETIGEVEWVYRSVEAEIIGITATAGKGTVTRWLSDVLTLAGFKAPAGGNIDPPLSQVAESGAILVTELSSFQLERCPSLKPKIAIIMNLGRDHLDRHGSLENYHLAKYQLLKNLDESSHFIFNADDPLLPLWASQTRAKAYSYSLDPAKARWVNAYRSAEGDLYMFGRKLLHQGELCIKGSHHHGNALAVALAANLKGVSDGVIAEGLRQFKGIEGRYSLVDSLSGVDFIEDSIATRGLAVKAALGSSPHPTVWILGGQDKGADFAELKDLIAEKVVLALLIGQAAPQFAQALEGLCPYQILNEKDGYKALSLACHEAFSHLKQSKSAEGTVLLAPLAASFDQFKDYKDRAKAFRQAVAELKLKLSPQDSPQLVEAD
ncbi:MAG: UDP-N-acetylmuramoyl-L-alanine--D-glutamate ligase [Deinococcales bacterium]